MTDSPSLPAADEGRMPYMVRKCGYHWHICIEGHDDAPLLDVYRFDSEEAARRECTRLNGLAPSLPPEGSGIDDKSFTARPGEPCDCRQVGINHACGAPECQCGGKPSPFDVERWQSDATMHPLTCGLNSNHRPLVAWGRFPGWPDSLLLACPDCTYTQRVQDGSPLANLLLTHRNTSSPSPSSSETLDHYAIGKRHIEEIRRLQAIVEQLETLEGPEELIRRDIRRARDWADTLDTLRRSKVLDWAGIEVLPELIRRLADALEIASAEADDWRKVADRLSTETHQGDSK